MNWFAGCEKTFPTDTLSTTWIVLASVASAVASPQTSSPNCPEPIAVKPVNCNPAIVIVLPAAKSDPVMTGTTSVLFASAKLTVAVHGSAPQILLAPLPLIVAWVEAEFHTREERLLGMRILMSRVSSMTPALSVIVRAEIVCGLAVL